MGVVASHGEYERDIYLPPGKWINYNSNEWFESQGEILSEVPIYRDGLLLLPAFVKAGAILPQMFVDEQTKDLLDKIVLNQVLLALNSQDYLNLQKYSIFFPFRPKRSILP